MEHDFTIVEIASSRFFGGPERQILELARELAPQIRTACVSFSEDGLCTQFLQKAREAGFEGIELENDTPHLAAASRELAATIASVDGKILICNGYKADILGLVAGRRLGLPVVGVAHGWTGESWRVRLYEQIDRWALRWMDRVVCVSEAQAAKVRRAGVPSAKIKVIRNAIRSEQFERPDPTFRSALEKMFRRAPRLLVGAAGRLSPEKGFGVLIESARRLTAGGNDVGFVLFGEGHLRHQLEKQIARLNLKDHFVLAGFTEQLNHYLPHFDLFVLPSFTEGLPVVVLEAFAAGVPVLATAVGGTPEVVRDRVNGRLVPPGDAAALAGRIGEMLADADARRQMGLRGQQQVAEEFDFSSQARAYEQMLGDLHDRKPVLAEHGCA